MESQVGQILPGSSHAWGESVGWVDFRPEEAELKIGGNILAGWIRIENLGWVHFGDGSPENGSRYSNRHSRDYGVNNDGEGRLSGWAWSENAGWISFDGVAIDVEGNFSGAAVSQNIGRIIFQSSGQTEFLVKTDPYPWMEIGTGVGIRAGTGFPVGGETIGIYSGSVKFTVPSSAGFSLFFPGRGEEKIEADPVFSLLLKELVIDPREAGKRGFIRGPPEGTTTVSTVESRAGEMLFQGPISLAFFCA